MRVNATALHVFVGLAIALVLSGAALAVPIPNAGGNRTVNEDVATVYTGTDSGSGALTYGWIFNGVPVNGNPASFTFTTPGSYAVSFWGDDGAGGNVSDSITVTVTDTTAPTANAGADQNVNEDTVVTFDGSASSDNDPNFGTTGRYYWTFTDGSTARSLSGKTATYTFATPGTFIVNLLVFDGAGNFASDSLVVTVKDVSAPSGSGTVPSSQNQGTSVAFSSSSVIDNDPNFASARRDYWTFTDGSAFNLSGTSASHTFATPGTFSITLTVMDSAGNKLTQVFSLIIVDTAAPTGSGTVPSNPNEDTSVSFSSSAITDNDPNFSSNRRDYWTFTDGSAFNISGTSQSHTFATPGTFTVNLLVMDNTGNRLTQSFTVTVKDITAPIGTISPPTSSNEDVLLTFSSAAITDNDPNFAAARRDYWTFTDVSARNLTGSSVTYTFNTPGSFFVTLLTMDSAGNRLTNTFTIVIADITAPTVTIAAGSSGQSMERFRSFTHSGSAVDNVAVSAYWWIFTDVSAQNVSGSSLTRQWLNTGVFTLTLFARDVAGNIGSTSTTFTVTPDVTAPTVSFLQAPTIGDNQNALTFQGTASDLDPACAASCNWTWSVDSVPFAYVLQTVAITFQPGQHIVSLAVRDPTGNTRTITTTVNIDQLVQTDTTWDTFNVTLNFNLRIVNGATFTIRNSQVWNSTLGQTVTINVVSGRLILQNSQMVSQSAAFGFRIIATGVNGAGSYLYFNQSTVSGLWDPVSGLAGISITNGTLSATDSTFKDIRVANGWTILGTNANLYLTNVTLNATVLTTTGGIRAVYTNLIAFGQRRETVIESLNASAVSRTPFQFSATGVVGQVDTTIRNSILRSKSPAATTHGIDLAITSSNGAFTFTFQGVDASNNNFGGFYAVHSAFTGTVAYNFTNDQFDNAVTGSGMYMQFTSLSSPTFAINMQNVSSSRASQYGFNLRFETFGSYNGAITMRQVDLSNNSRDGFYIYHSGSGSTSATRLTATIAMTDTNIQFNRGNGLFLDSYYGLQSSINFRTNNVKLTDNSARGIYLNINYASYNVSLDLTDTQVNRNGNEGLYFYLAPTDSYSVAQRGNYWLNFTRTSFSNNARGLYFYQYYYGMKNITGMWNDVSIDNNSQQGIWSYNPYLYNTYDQNGRTAVPMSNFTIWGDRVSISKNGGDGFYSYEYYLYGASNTNNLQSLYNMHFNNSHIDSNGGHGFQWYACPYYYCQYATPRLELWLSGATTVSGNSASGIYTYLYYNYMFNGPGSEVNINVLNSSIVSNGFSGSDNGGIYEYYPYYEYSGSRLLNVSGSQISNNAGDGIYRYFANQYYEPAALEMRVRDSDISHNGRRGIETYYGYLYSIQGGIVELIDNNSFIANGAEAILHQYPQGYGRQLVPWSLTWTNNRIDQSPTNAMATGVSYSCANCPGYGGSEYFNISGNRITNVAGAAVAFSFDPPHDSSQIDVAMWGNYVADVEDGITMSVPGSTNTQHHWAVVNNTVERSNGNAMLISMSNQGQGNAGSLTFERNTFKNTGGTAFTLVQDHIKMQTLSIKDCVFNAQRTAIQVSGLQGIVDNATFTGSVKEDISLSDGTIDIHNTVVDPAKLKPVGGAAAFNVWFHLKLYVVWSGTGKPVVGAVVQMADSGANTFFVGTISDATGIPSMELWSYTKTAQGVLGRSPFAVDVTYFEIEQVTSVDLYSDRVVTIEVRDNVLPTVVISNPEDGFGTQSDTIQMDGSVFDSQSGFSFDINDPQLAAQNVEVSSDGTTWSPVHVKSSSTFEVQFDYTFTGLGENVNALYVRVHDDANNYFTRVIPVRIDRTAPLVRILSPASSSIITNKPTITLSAETEVGAQIYVNGLTPPEVLTRPDGIHSYFIMEIRVFEGPNTITVVAIDALNNQGNASLFAFVDLQPPYLAVIAPDVDALVNTTTLVVSGQTERTGVTVTVNGVEALVDSFGNFTATVPLSLDVNSVSILATDTAGNTQLVVRNVRVDRTGPWINIQSPANNALLGSPEVDVVGIVEPGSTLIVNDEVVSAPTGAFTRRILLTEGDNSIQFVAIDPAGNAGYRTVFVTVDTVNPVIAVATPANESLVSAGNVVVSGQVTDAHTPSLFVNGREVALNTNGTFSFVAVLFEGTNFISIEARDGAGNSATTVLTVLSDTQAPYVLPELDGTFLEGAQVKTYASSVTVKGFAEKGSEVQVCALLPSAAPSDAPTCNAIPLAADGQFRTFVDMRVGETNTITVTARDASGNTNTRQLQVFATQAPVAEAPSTPVGVYALYGLGLALLGGAFFLLYMRRGKNDERTALAGAETMPYEAQGPSDLSPQVDGEMGAPSGELAAYPSPEVSGDVDVTTAPEEQAGLDATSPPEEGAPEASALEGEVPSAPSRTRPMRRRPVGEGEAEGEGSTLTGLGAEEEAQPGDIHQDETKEG
jgi:hypothetical protein